MKKTTQIILIVLGVLILDQSLKVWIKTTFEWQEQVDILGLSWAKLKFIENNGMAFGMEFGGRYGKVFLSVFRILAVGLLIYIIRTMLKEKTPRGVLVCFALILAGAIGNIIDSTFYGLIFDKGLQIDHQLGHVLPYRGVAEIGSPGYAPIFMGAVVDMLYFPLVDSYWPEWVPYFGGRRLHFFAPIFNIADAAISIGVIGLLLFYRSYFAKSADSKKE